MPLPADNTKETATPPSASAPSSADEAKPKTTTETTVPGALDELPPASEKAAPAGGEGAAVSAATTAGELKEGGEDGGDMVPEEEVLEGDWMRPHVDIKEIEVKTGEEDEETFWKQRAKLYRWAKDSAEWKERGLGDAKLLRHKSTGKIRFLLRQEKTLKIVANHYVMRHGSFCQLKPNVASDKIWVWSVTDYSEDPPKVEQFGLKFGQVESAAEFKTKFEEAAKLNADHFAGLLHQTKKTEECPLAEEKKSPLAKEKKD